MDQTPVNCNYTPPAMDRHLEVLQCHKDGGLLLGASSLTGRYWYGSLWYYGRPDDVPDVEKCTAGVQLEAGLCDACWVDDNRVLVAMDTGGVALWELTDNRHTFIQQSSASEHDNIVSSVCVCKDNNNLISASYDNSVKIWDTETFKSIHTYRGHYDSIFCVCSHPSETNIFLTSSLDGSVALWDTRKSKPASRLNRSPLQSAPTCVTWRPGMEHSYAVGSEEGQLLVKDTRSAVTDVVNMTPHHRSITRLQFAKTRNSVLASISEDCTVMVIDIAEEQPKQIFRSTSHRDFVQGLSWDAGDRLYTCGWDSRVFTHVVPGLTQDSAPSSETGPSKMEVNGEPVNHSVNQSSNGETGNDQSGDCKNNNQSANVETSKAKPQVNGGDDSLQQVSQETPS